MDSPNSRRLNSAKPSERFSVLNNANPRIQTQVDERDVNHYPSAFDWSRNTRSVGASAFDWIRDVVICCQWLQRGSHFTQKPFCIGNQRPAFIIEQKNSFFFPYWESCYQASTPTYTKQTVDCMFGLVRFGTLNALAIYYILNHLISSNSYEGKKELT